MTESSNGLAASPDIAPAPDPATGPAPELTEKQAAAHQRKQVEGRGEEFIAALLREREGLVQRGLTERVKEVDKQIEVYGGKPPRTTQNSTPTTTTSPAANTTRPARKAPTKKAPAKKPATKTAPAAPDKK